MPPRAQCPVPARLKIYQLTSYILHADNDTVLGPAASSQYAGQQCPHLLSYQAMGSTWHPECFCCEMCNKELADLGFIKNQGRALCHECNAKVGLDTLSTLTRL